MVNAQTIRWAGKSGQEYAYWIYPIDTTWTTDPGNYIFAKETRPGYWTPIYIGQTGDLSERFDYHHKMPCIKRNGATHICVHKGDASEKIRQDEENDLTDRWNPPCNG